MFVYICWLSWCNLFWMKGFSPHYKGLLVSSFNLVIVNWRYGAHTHTNYTSRDYVHLRARYIISCTNIYMHAPPLCVNSSMIFYM